MTHTSKISRRRFITSSLGAGAGLLILPSGVVRGASTPNSKLNIAVIGVAGRGSDNLDAVSGENIAALCDVDEDKLAAAAKKHPQAQTYADWRKCLEQKGLDAVVCSTPDHTHAFINVWAMNRGLHVYCEKPLANSVHEARTVRETHLRHKGRLATQMGTQIHANDNYRRVVELIRDGAIGRPQEVRVWCGRTPKGGNYLPDAGAPPANLHWDLWVGPSAPHPYHPDYFGGCTVWNRYWDFGSGTVGDMGSHLIDLAYWAYDLRFPTSCEAAGTPVSTDTCPEWLTATWEHPATARRPAVSVHWYDGGKKPGMPLGVFDSEKLFNGLIFKGDAGWLVADYNLRILAPKGDMTQYQSPKAGNLIPPSPGHHEEWIKACKTGSPTLCNFDYSGALIEHNLLALVAYRTGKKLQWDAASLKATNVPEAEAFIRKTYREGWVLNG